jgi:hypothetical protein
VLKDLFIAPSQHEFDPSFMQALLKHSRDKDQFLKVTIKRMTETHIFEYDLKEVSELNSLLLAEKQDLEVKLAKESQAKVGEYSINFYPCN